MSSAANFSVTSAGTVVAGGRCRARSAAWSCFPLYVAELRDRELVDRVGEQQHVAGPSPGTPPGTASAATAPPTRRSGSRSPSARSGIFSTYSASVVNLPGSVFARLEQQQVGDLLAVRPVARQPLLQHRPEALVEREVLVELDVLHARERVEDVLHDALLDRRRAAGSAAGVRARRSAAGRPNRPRPCTNRR